MLDLSQRRATGRGFGATVRSLRRRSRRGAAGGLRDTPIALAERTFVARKKTETPETARASIGSVQLGGLVQRNSRAARDSENDALPFFVPHRPPKSLGNLFLCGDSLLRRAHLGFFFLLRFGSPGAAESVCFDPVLAQQIVERRAADVDIPRGAGNVAGVPCQRFDKQRVFRSVTGLLQRARGFPSGRREFDVFRTQV